MAVKGIIQRIQAGPVMDASRIPAIRAEREAREQANESAKSSAQLADQLAKRSRDAHHAAGGAWSAFRGKKLAPVQSRMTDANGRGVDEVSGLDVLNEAYDD